MRLLLTGSWKSVILLLLLTDIGWMLTLLLWLTLLIVWDIIQIVARSWVSIHLCAWRVILLLL